MRSYQIDGLRWLVKQHSNAVGGILGDEMGLGKTLQVCSFIGYLASVLGEPGPYLVVSPLSVMETWVNEFRRWVPSLRVVSPSPAYCYPPCLLTRPWLASPPGLPLLRRHDDNRAPTVSFPALPVRRQFSAAGVHAPTSRSVACCWCWCR